MISKNEQLQDYFDFDDEDLAQNKQGVVTESQKKELTRRRLVMPIRNVIASSVIVIVITLIIVFNGGLFFLKHAPYYFMAGGFIILVAGGSFIPLFFEKQNLQLKTAHGQAKIVDRLKEQMALSENGSTHNYGGVPYRSSLITEMFVEGIAFGVNGIVEKGDICRIYYVNNNDIIAIEVFD